jgi:DNA invertase Pin-like site-specific DNA recombinase
LKTVLYSRISTSGQSHESQEAEVQSFAKRQGWEGLEVYRDTISGATKNRPELDRLLKDARAGKVERILCFKMDRIGRSLLNLINLLQELAALKVPVYFTSQGISTEETNPSSKLMIGMLGLFAEFERDIIRERIKAGIATARAQGKHLGGKRMPPGIEEKVIDLIGEGLSMNQIAKRAGVSVGYVHKISNKEPK